MKKNDDYKYAGKMLDAVIAENHLKNDAALACALGVSQSVISRARNKTRCLRSSLLLRLHEFTGKSTKELKKMANGEIPEFRSSVASEAKQLVATGTYVTPVESKETIVCYGAGGSGKKSY